MYVVRMFCVEYCVSRFLSLIVLSSCEWNTQTHNKHNYFNLIPIISRNWNNVQIFLFSSFLHFDSLIDSNLNKTTIKYQIILFFRAFYFLFCFIFEDYKWKILAGRLFGGGSKALWGRALPQICKLRFGGCVGEIAFPPSRDPAKMSFFIFSRFGFFILTAIRIKFKS